MKTAMNSYQIRKNINDLEQSICKYSDLLSNVLNFQETCSKSAKTVTESSKNQSKSMQQLNNRQPLRKHSALIKTSNAKPKFANKLSSSLISNNNNNNTTNIPSNYSKSIKPKHQSILKQSASISQRPHTSVVASTASSRLKTALNTNTNRNFVLQKSKSADNINRNCLNKTTSGLKKNDLYKSVNIDDMSKQLDCLNQKLNIKPENREKFVSKLLNLIKNHQDEPTSNEFDLESKLDSMKNEIDRLKSKLTKNTTTNNNKQIANSNSSTSLQSTSSSSSSSITFDSNDAKSNMNIIVSSYSDKLSQMQKQINELTMLNKSLILEKSYRQQQQHSPKEIDEIKNNKNESDRQHSMIIEKLRNELKDSNERCKVLDYLLEQKTRENEQFTNLLREIGENVSVLIKELEQNEKSKNNHNPKQDNLALCATNCKRKSESNADSISLNVVKESLVNFQKKLHIQPNFQYHQLKPTQSNNNQTTPLVINHLEKTTDLLNKTDNHNNNPVNQNLVKTTSKIFMSNFKSANNSATTSSDTLIDADSSFESNNLFRKNSLINKSINNSRYDIEKSTINSTTFKSLTNNLINNYQDSDDSNDGDEDGYDDNNGIVIALQDLTISTMQTSNNEITTNNESIANLNIKDEDQFAEGLKMLDQKIFKVKKLLETMKNS